MSGLAERGHHVRAVVAHPHYPAWKIDAGYGQWARRENYGDVAVERLRHYVPRRPSPIPRALSEVTFGLRQVLTRWGRPTAIVAVSPALLSSALVRLRALTTHRRTPFVVWVQDLYGLGVLETGQGGGFAARAILAVERWLLRSASLVVVIHDRFADRVIEDFGMPRNRIAVVRNWSHLQPLPPVDTAAVRQANGWADDEVIVVHTGNMGVKQGLHHVVEAGRLANVRGDRVRFILVGNGSQRGELERQIQTLATTTELMEPLDDRAFGEVLQAADVLLVNELPGVAEMAVPSKLTSYFASGRPVLAATDAAGITAAEIAAAQAGLTVPAGSAEAILDGAKRLASDSEESVRLGANGRRYKEHVLGEALAIDQFDSLLANLRAAAVGKLPPHLRSS